MKCQILFSRKNKKRIISLLTAKLAHSMVSAEPRFQHLQKNTIFLPAEATGLMTDGLTVAVVLPLVCTADCTVFKLLPLRFVCSFPALFRLPVLLDPRRLELDDLVEGTLGTFSEAGFTRFRFAAGAYQNK